MEILFWVFLIILGLMVGSFLNVVIVRVPKGESIVFPSSHCCACGAPLQARDLVPVFSFLLLKGRCRACGARISPRYMVVELLCAGLFAVCAWRFGFSLALLPALVFSALLLAVAAIDLEHNIIPNGLVIFGLCVGALSCGFSLLVPWWEALIGLVAGGVPLLLIDLLSRLVLKREGMGGGDMKLMAMAGLFLGWKLVLLALLLSFWIGALYAAVLIFTGKLRRGDRGVTMPFGPSLAAGSLVALWFGKDLITWYLSVLSV